MIMPDVEPTLRNALRRSCFKAHVASFPRHGPRQVMALALSETDYLAFVDTKTVAPTAHQFDMPF